MHGLEYMLDTRYSTETPEGIELQADLAGPMVRIMAYLVDFIIRWGIIIILGFVLTQFSKVGTGIVLLASFFIEWLYPVFFEVYRQGQTPGKKSYQLLVVNDDLTPVTLRTSLTRNLVRAADFLPLFFIFGLITMVCNSRFQRLGDIAAGTIVVFKPELTHPTLEQTLSPKAPPFYLSEADELAFIDFAERANQLSESRQKELADIISPAFERKDQQNMPKTIKNIAAWLLGQRN